MRACQDCNGDGMVWVADNRMHPQTNISRRRYRSSNGRSGVFYGQNLLADAGERFEWQFECPRCNGKGIYEATRGKSLPPLVGRA